MAEVEEEGEHVIVEDEEDTNIDLDSEDDEDDWGFDDEDDNGNENMYDSPLDNIDEVLHFQNQLNNLQAAGGAEMYNFLMQQLSQEEAQSLQYSMQAAQSYEQEMAQARAAAGQ